VIYENFVVQPFTGAIAGYPGGSAFAVDITSPAWLASLPLGSAMPRENLNYWKFFNFFGKVFGSVFAVGCGILSIWSFTTDNVNPTDAIIGGVLSAVMSVLGILMILSKPSDPKAETTGRNKRLR
jgi:hypothetical protein